MRTTKILILFLALIILFLFGCASNSSQGEEDIKKDRVEKIKLYYGDANNEKMVTEEREISFPQGVDKYKLILEELIKGPENQELTANIAENTKVYGTIKQKSDLIVNFSKEFNQFGGSVAEIIAVGSIINTITQLDDIERIKIMVEGEELMGSNGEPRGFMTSFPKQPDNEEGNTDVVLYFSNKNADKVVGEKRKVTGSPEENKEDFIKEVLEELIAGPLGEEIYRTIPKEVVVVSVSINQGTVLVDFSEEMHTKHWGGAAGESMTINSIVNTLTEFDFIKRVQITVNQKPLAIEHMILEDPVERNEAIIGS